MNDKTDTYFAADDERRTVDVVVLALGDEVELLAGSAVASRECDRDKVLTEVARARVNGEALAVRILNLRRGECAGSRIIANLSFGDGGLIEDRSASRCSSRRGRTCGDGR